MIVYSFEYQSDDSNRLQKWHVFPITSVSWYKASHQISEESPKLEIVLGESMNISETNKHVVNFKFFHAPKNHTSLKYLKHTIAWSFLRRFPRKKITSSDLPKTHMDRSSRVPPTGYVFFPIKQTFLPLPMEFSASNSAVRDLCEWPGLRETLAVIRELAKKTDQNPKPNRSHVDVYQVWISESRNKLKKGCWNRLPTNCHKVLVPKNQKVNLLQLLQAEGIQKVED